MLDDLTEEQKQIVTAAQDKFKDLKERTNPLDEGTHAAGISEGDCDARAYKAAR